VSVFLTKGAAHATITAPSIAHLVVTGDFGTDLNTGVLGTAVVTGKLTGAHWTLAGNNIAIIVGEMLDTTIYDGIVTGTTGLPSTADAFTGSFSIGRVIVRGVAKDPVAFSNSFIAAA